MVKKTFFTFLSITSTVLLIAGEFTASVSTTQIRLGESFSLYLTLKDTFPKEAPEVSTLTKHFLVHSQQHSTNTSIVNGKVSSNITWKLSLSPRIEGKVQIPSMTIETEEGLLSTQPITLNAIKSPSSQSNNDHSGLNITSNVSNSSPYKNEPFIYTTHLSSKLPLYNIQTQKMHVEDAIVELVGEPKLEEKVIGGVLLHVVDFTYLITPLKAGPLTIRPITIQGAIPQKRKEQFNSFDDFDPFAIMQGFDRVKPFTLITEEIQLDVQPAVSEVSPWLPAKELTLEEQWPNDQTLRLEEPFSRGFLIQAKGLKASQLPHLEDMHNQNALFKAYTDKPEEQEEVLQGQIQSKRKEQYTLIPQQAGTWVLPEISIDWWDSIKKEKRTTTLPARTVQILPALATTSLPQQKDPSPLDTTTNTTNSSAQPTVALYGIIGMLTLFLTAALLWGLTLHRKIESLTLSKKPIQPSPIDQKKPISQGAIAQKEKKEKLPNLNPT